MPWRRRRNQHSMALKMLSMLTLLTAQVSRVTCGWVLQGPKPGRAAPTSGTGQVLASNLAQTIREDWAPHQSPFLPVNTHPCLQNWAPLGPNLERFHHPGLQAVVMIPGPQDAVGACTQTPLQCKMLPEYLNQGAQCGNQGTSTCLQRPRNWYGTPCKWRKTNMIAERTRHVQLCTLFSIELWIFTPWTDPARLALIHATVQPVHANTGSLRTLPLSCLLAHSAWRPCPLNARYAIHDLEDGAPRPAGLHPGALHNAVFCFPTLH